MNDTYEFMRMLYEPLLSGDDTPAAETLPLDALSIGRDPIDRKVVRYITMADLATSAAVMGGTGSGKSNLLRVMLRQLIYRKKKYNEGFTVIDLGNLAPWVLLAIAQMYPELARDVVYVDLTHELGVTALYNPLAYVTHRHLAATSLAEELLRVFGAGSVADKPLVGRMLRMLAETLIELELSLSDSRFFLDGSPTDRVIAERFVDQLPEASPLRSFWLGLWKKSRAAQDVSVVGPSVRLDLFNAPALRRMVAATGTGASLDLKAMMDQGGILIANLARSGSGVSVDAQLGFSRLLLEGIRQRLEQRRPDHSRTHVVCIDEFGLVAPASYADVMVTARKYGVYNIVSFQALSMLIKSDNDRTLHDVVVATPTKLLMKGIPFKDCQLLAEESFLTAIDPMRVKYEHETTHWDPVLKKVVVRSTTTGTTSSETETESRGRTVSRGHSDGTSESTGLSSASGSMHSRGANFELGGIVPAQRSCNHGSRQMQGTSATSARSHSESESESESEAHASATSRGVTSSETLAEQWITDHRGRKEKKPEFSPLAEQIHDHAARLKLQPRGHVVLIRPDQEPVNVAVDHFEDSGLSFDDVDEFLAEVVSKPCYARVDELDRLLEERDATLLAEAGPQVESMSPPRRRRRKTVSQTHKAAVDADLSE